MGLGVAKETGHGIEGSGGGMGLEGGEGRRSGEEEGVDDTSIV